MQSAIWFLRIAAFVLLSSICAVVASSNAQWAEVVPYLMWNHLAVIVLCGYAAYRLRKMTTTGAPTMRSLFPVWLLVAAFTGLFAVVANWPADSSEDALKSLDGSPVLSSHWHSSGPNGPYFARVNREPEREISRAQYQELNQQIYGLFSRVWVGLSIVALFLWNLALQRYRVESDGAASTRAGGMSSEGSPVGALSAPSDVSNRRQASSLLIVAIWCAVPLMTLLQLNRPIDPLLCKAELFSPLILLMPFVVFGIGAMTVKRAPLYSPWVAQMVDAKFGTGVYENFLIRLKPAMLFGIASFATAMVSAFGCGVTNVGQAFGKMMPMFFFSSGFAFIMMHFIMRYRKIPGA